MAFTDVLGDYLSNRFDRATQPFTDPEAYLRQRLLDEEEERKRKEREDAAKKAAEESAAQQRAIEQAQAPTAPTTQPGQPAYPGQSGAVVPSSMAAPNPYGSNIAQGQTAQPVGNAPATPVAPEPQDNIEEQRRLQQAQQAAQPAPSTGQGLTMANVPPQQQLPQMSMEERIAAATERARQRAEQGQPAPQPQAQPAPAPAPTPAPQLQAAAPAAPVAPTPAPFTAAAAPAMPALPTPGPGVQVASTEPTAGVAEAARAAQAPAAAPAPEAPPARDHLDDVADIYNDPAKLIAYSRDEKNPREGRLMAAKLLKKQATQLEEQQKAEDIIQSGDVTAMERAIRSKKEEGSILKAMLYARLGLTKLAEDEQAKLGAGAKYVSAVGPNNERALVQYDANGLPIGGFDTAGRELTPKQLAMFGANALPSKGYLLPSVHGSPVINAKGEIGTLMMDPRSQQTYVLVGNERRPTTGWTTMAQNVQNVYSAAGAKKQGEQAAEGFQNQPLPAYPGGGAPAGTENAVQIATRLGLPIISGARDEAKQRQLWDESVRAGRTGFTKEGNPIARPGTSKHENAMAVDLDVARMTPEQKQLAQQNGLISRLPNDPGHFELRPTVRPGASVAEQKKALSVAEAAAKEEIQVAGKRSESFNKHIDENITPEASNGDTVSTLRKQQFQLFDRPGVDAGKIFGIANGAGQAPGDQRWTMFRDVLLGKVSEPADKIRERAASLGLNPQEQSAVAEYAIANAEINAKTLKSTAGAGSVSDAEQAANRERNVDITKIPILGGYNAMAQSQFNGDLAKYKGDWATTSKASNTAELEKDWRKEKQRLVNMYTDVAKQRIDYIDKMGRTAAAVQQAYRNYPVPTYNAETGEWIKKKPLSSFER